jgi:hypothetical protein
MRETALTLPEIGLIAATRGVLGAGLGFRLAERVPESQRKTLGWTLFSIGAISTIPLALTVFGRSRCMEPSESAHRRRRQEQCGSDDRRVREKTLAAGT